MANTNPIIIVHGIQGSWLKDEYQVDYQKEILWTGVLRKKFAALHLHDMDSSVDADDTRLVNPHQAVPLIYESLVDEIREEVEGDHPYVYVFTYDWRKDNRIAAALLDQFVQRVLHIAGVHEQKRKPRRPKPKKVSLVGHSMGGLVIKWYATKILNVAVARKTIDKIITIATPYRGSLKAVEAILPGARNLFGVETSKSMRHASRTMPGIYQLLPSWPKAVVDAKSGRELKIFSPDTWQKSLVSSLKAKYRPDFFKRMLTDAKAFTTSMKQPWPEELRRKVYTAYGVNTPTWWQVPVDTTKRNLFMFNEARTGGKLGSDTEGDGTVPVTSSVCSEIGKKNRLQDLTLRFRDILAGHHANMPNHRVVQDWLLGKLGLNEHHASSFESPS